MGMARAGDQIPVSVAKHHIFSVHTAVPSKGTADFFYSTYFSSFPDKNTKEYSIFNMGAPFLRSEMPTM